MQSKLYDRGLNNKPWTQGQSLRFIEGLTHYQGNWQKISQFVETRSVLEVYAHCEAILEGSNQEMQNTLREHLGKEDSNLISLEGDEEVSQESFFAQKIYPMVSGGYRGLSSLIDGFSQSEGSTVSNQYEFK